MSCTTKPDLPDNFRFELDLVKILSIPIFQTFSFVVVARVAIMSAKAAYNKFLELEKLSNPIANPLPVGIKSSTDVNHGWEVFILVIFCVILRLILALVRWHSRLRYFKAKRSSSSCLCALYYTFLYPNGIGNNH